MAYALDFAELKQRVSIEQVAAWIGAQLKPHGAQLRGPCPICKAGGDRAFVITPAKGCYYCFGECRKGGDVIALVANARASFAQGGGRSHRPSVRRAIRSRNGSRPFPPAPAAGERGAETARLSPERPRSSARPGLSEETAQAFGLGYAPRGILRGRVAVPIRDRAGVLLAYCGIAASNEQSPRFLFPSNFDPASAIFNADRIAAGELNLLGNIVQVLEAFQNGVENTVCFLTEGVSAQQLEQLASLMDQKKVDCLTL